MLSAVTLRLADRHAALDVVQDAWVRVTQGLSSFRVGLQFRPWLFTILFNTLHDHMRRQGRRVDGAAVVLPEERLVATESHGGMQTLDANDAIGVALQEVEEPFRTAVHLIDILGMDYAEASHSLDCAEGTVKSRVHRGRRAFCENYERLVGAGQTSAASSPGGMPTRNCT